MNTYLNVRKDKKENMCTKSFFFTEFIYKDFINRDIVFSIFTTLYRIGNIVINILQLRVFALDTQYSFNQVSVVSLPDFYQKLSLSLLYAS